MTLSIVRVGTFSGSGPSLRDALAARTEVSDFDLITLAKKPALWLARLLGLREASRASDFVPFSKTEAWSRGLQRALPASAIEHPTLFVQTTAALDLPPGTRYAIYTDRLGKEGVAVTNELHRSRATRGWLAREHGFVVGAEQLFVMGPTSKDHAIREYGFAPDRVHVVGGAPNATLGPHNTSTECRRLLFVGLDWRRKGLPDLLEAFSVVGSRKPGLQLDVVGGTPTGHVPDGVNLHGRVPHAEMRRFFSNADALVIPTHVEAFGIALVEALMMGIPVIGTTAGNQEFIIDDGGLLVEPGDSRGLAAAIESMIDDYPAHKAGADRRRLELLQSMTWEHIAAKILERFPGRSG